MWMCVLHIYQDMLIAQIPLTLFHDLSLLTITLGRSSKRHPVSTQSRLIYIFAVQPILVCSRVGTYSGTLIRSLVSAEQYSAYLVYLTWMICEMGGKWLYKCCFLSCELLFSKICSKQHAASFCSSHLAFFPSISLKVKWCIHITALT